MKFLFLISILALLQTSCGRKEKEEEQAPPPSLKQSFSDDAQSAGVAYVLYDNVEKWSLTVATRFKSTVRQGDACREYLRFDFTPQRKNSDETSDGNLWFSVGCNPFGEAFLSTEEIYKYEKANGPFPGKEPREAFFKKESSEEHLIGERKYGEWTYIVTDDIAKSSDGSIRGQIRSYYLRITNQRSFIFRVASKFSYDELWPEQQAEVEKTLGSLVFKSNN